MSLPFWSGISLNDSTNPSDQGFRLEVTNETHLKDFVKTYVNWRTCNEVVFTLLIWVLVLENASFDAG